MPIRAKKRIKTIAWILGISLLLIGLLAYSLRLASVQKYLADQLTEQLSQKLNAPVSIDGFYFEWGEKLNLQGLQVKDQQDQALLELEHLSASIGLFALLQQKVHLDEITIEGLNLYTYRSATDSSFNYQFILDELTRSDPTDTTTAQPWNLGLDQIAIRNIQFQLNDSLKGQYLSSGWTELELAVEDFQLATQKVAIDRLALSGAWLDFEKTKLALDTTTTGDLSFPALPWELQINEARIDSSSLRYHTAAPPRSPEYFDPNHLDLKELQLNLRNFTWGENTLQGALENLTLQEGKQWRLEEAKTDFELNSQKISLEALSLRTSDSYVAGDSQLDFDTWSDLTNFMDAVSYRANFTESYLGRSDLLRFVPQLPVDRQWPNSIVWSGSVQGNGQLTSLDQLQFTWGDLLQLKAGGKLGQLKQINKLTLDFPSLDLQMDYAELRRRLPQLGLPAQLDSLGQLDLKAEVAGSLAQLRFRNARLKTESGSELNWQGALSSLTQTKDLTYDLAVDHLWLPVQDLSYLAGVRLDTTLRALEYLKYQGQLQGNLLDITTLGQLNCALGELATDLEIHFDSAYQDASYGGKLGLTSFDLGPLLGDTVQFGKVAAELTLQGEGLRAADLSAAVTGTIQEFNFRQYVYHNLSWTGDLAEQRFLGKASMSDPNLQFDFEGLIDFHTPLPRFQFQAEFDTINFTRLGWLEQNLQTSFQVDSDFSAKGIDDFVGHLRLSDWYLSDSLRQVHADSFRLSVEPMAGKEKSLQVASDWLELGINGDFQLSELGNAMLFYLDRHFPLPTNLVPPDSLRVDQQFDFALQGYELDRLLSIFDKGFEKLDTLTCQGHFSTVADSLAFQLRSPSVKYQGWALDSFSVAGQGNHDRIKLNLLLPHLSREGQAFRANALDIQLQEQSLAVDFDIGNDLAQSVLRWGLILTTSNEDYQAQFRDSLWWNQTSWALQPQHEFHFGPNQLYIDQFDLRRAGQQVSLKTLAPSDQEPYAPLELSFSNFQLTEFSSLLNIDNFDFEGLLNGQLRLRNFTTNPHYLADLTCTNLTLNDSLIGQLDVQAGQAPNSQKIELGVKLSGGENEMEINGDYAIDQRTFAIEGQIGRVPMILFDPLSIGSIQASRGYLSGAFTLQGTPEEPALKGQLTFNDASTHINYLQSRYTITSGQMLFDESEIRLPKIQLQDELENKATLAGQIRHNYFRDPQLDLGFTTDRFRLLNTKAGDNELFYGQLYIAAQVDISGPLDLPKIQITAQSKEGSQLYVEASADTETTQQDDFLIFANPDSIGIDSFLSIRNEGNSSFDFDLLLNLELGPEAELIVIVDPYTGDQLRCQGNADLSVRMSPTQDLDITGVYTLVDGDYQFNYEGLIKRSFQLSPGGQLNFIGDPLDTRFNLSAEYHTRTKLNSLVFNESLNTGGGNETQDVHVILSMEGDLNQPELSFDIRIPSIEDSEWKSLTDQKLAQLRENESELNKQVFGLLLLNSFVVQQSASTSISAAGENIALASVSNLITNQLNQLSERYISGLGLSFDFVSERESLDSYGTNTQLNVDLQQSLFNDRLSLKVGGVADLDGSQNNLTDIAGDFVLEYKLSPKGNYLLRVFQRSDSNAFDGSRSNKTGVGLQYKKSFGK